jgi:protein FAM50
VTTLKDQLRQENEQEVEELKQEIKRREQEKKRKKMKSSLSFLNEEEEEERGMGEEEEKEDVVLPNKRKAKKMAKNPDVDTSHLPDRERDARLLEERERLTQEWLAQQEIIKNQVRDILSSPPSSVPSLINSPSSPSACLT